MQVFVVRIYSSSKYSECNMGRGGGSGNGAGWGSGQYKGKFERVMFPAMPMPMAIICCILNFIIPGLGSAIAGLAVFCCSRNEDLDTAPRALSCFTSCGIGLLQLLTTLLLFIGWFWSCFWGVTYIVVSLEYYHNNKVDDHDRGTATVQQVPTTHTIYEAGSSTPIAIIVQPTHLPYRVGQPGHASKTGQGNVTKQPLSAALNTGNMQTSLDPPPYPGNYGGVIPGPLPAEPPPVYAETEKPQAPPSLY